MTTTAQEPAQATAAREDGPVRLSHRQVLTILSGLLLGMLLAALDQTIVSASIVKIANSLHGFDLQAWATTAYLITATITTPIYGKLSDIYGRKPFYLVAISLFLIGSIASTFATSMYELAAFRAFQGLGAGGLMSLAMTIIGDIVPPRERSKYQGYFMIVFGTSTVLGPVLGGFFAGLDKLGGIDGWRWVFLINVPIGIIALIVVSIVLNVPHERQNHRIDWFGGLFLIVCLVPLLILAEQGQKWGWGSTRALVCYAVGAVGLILFLIIEKAMKEQALIPLRLFRNSTFSVSIVASFIVGIAMFGAITMVPQYLQVVKGYSPTKGGLLLLPLMLGIMIGAMVSGQLTARTGRYKIMPVVGTFLIAVASLLYAQLHYDTPLWYSLLFSGLFGLGLGGCIQTLIIAAQNAGPRRDMGVSTAAATFFRQIGGTLGVAVFLTILFNVLLGKITDAFGGHVPASALGSLSALQSNTSIIQSQPDSIKIPELAGFTGAISTVFYVAAGVGLLSFVVLLFLKEIPLSGGAPAVAAMEGAEPLLENAPAKQGAAMPSAPAAIENVDAEDTVVLPALQEPELVTVGSPALGNGHGRYQFQAAASGAPITSAIARSSAGASAGTGGQPVIGHVRRPDGTAVSGAALTLIDQRGHQVARGTGNTDGSYRLPTPSSGTYVLIVAAAGHQPQASSVVVGTIGPATLDITLTGSGGLRGVVRETGTGTPLVDATVTLTDYRGDVTGAYITQLDGAYSFSGVSAGYYTLVASGPSYRPAAVTLTVPESGVLRHDIELTSAVQLVGTARTDGDRLVPDARITVLDVSGSVAAVARTDAEGRYVVSDLPAGAYTVVASGYPPATSQVTLGGGGEETHDVRLGYDQALDEFAEASHHQDGRP